MLISRSFGEKAVERNVHHRNKQLEKLQLWAEWLRGYIDPKVPYVFQKQLLNTVVILKLGMLSILFSTFKGLHLIKQTKKENIKNNNNAENS